MRVWTCRCDAHEMKRCETDLPTHGAADGMDEMDVETTCMAKAASHVRAAWRGRSRRGG